MKDIVHAGNMQRKKLISKQHHMEPNPDFLKIGLNIAAGVCVFLYGMTILSDTLHKLEGDKMQQFLARFTTSTLAGILTGTLVTAIMGSSSIVIIMTIALVNAHILTFKQSLGVIMGSNIGTTVATQIIAFKVSDYCAVILVIGLAAVLMAKNDHRKNIGTVITCVGLIFFGLEFMDTAVLPLREHKPFTDMMLKLENPMVGVLAGGLFTVIIQASSATVAIAISLASHEMISLAVGISLMMGAEIGTCSDTLLATLGRSREAMRTGVFHLLFNLFSVALGLLLIEPFTDLVVWISAGASIARQIANAHFLFNVMGVIIFAAFTPIIAKALQKIMPQTPVGKAAGGAS
jgi:phosphate:Na+ symporter